MGYFRRILELASAFPTNVEGKFTFDGVKYDQVEGVGSVPDNQNVEYMGFAAVCTANKFLDLSKPLRNPNPNTISYLEEGEPIGSPFFLFNLEEMKITGHEGRHRALHFKPRDILIHVFLTHGDRARNITSEHIDQLFSKVTSEWGGTIQKPFKAIYLNKKWLQP